MGFAGSGTKAGADGLKVAVGTKSVEVVLNSVMLNSPVTALLTVKPSVLVGW
jgi:hypothetical protein